MAKIPKWLKSLGGLLLTVGSLITYSWWSAMIAAGAVALAGWKWAAIQVESPVVHSLILVFLAALWTIVGLTVLADRKKPMAVIVKQNLEYGLTFEGLNANYSPTSDDATLQFQLGVRNYTSVPIRYDIKIFEIIISHRTLPKLPDNLLKGFLQRGAGKTASNAPFVKDDIKDFFGKKVTGTVDISIIYGHAEKPPERQLDMSFDVHLDFTSPLLLFFVASITSESDISIPNLHQTLPSKA